MRTLSCYLLMLLLPACLRQEKIQFSVSESTLADAYPGDCPYLTKDNLQRPVLSWVRTTSDSTAVFCFAVSDDKGKTFGQPVIIPSSTNIYAHSENLPKIIFRPNGEAIAIWGTKNESPENKYAGLVYYARSADGGKTWSEANKLVHDADGYDQRYADIALMKNGEVALIWLDNRKSGKEMGSALYFARTTGSNGFTGIKKISEPACQCCRTSLFVDHEGNIHALYRGIINDSIRDMVHVVSNDGGNSFSEPVRIHHDNWVLNGCPHTGPAMTENSRGLQFAWYTGGNIRGSFYSSSSDRGTTFEQYDSITGQGSHPQLSVLPDEKVVTVWDELVKGSAQFNKRIGMQVRSDTGASLLKGYITADSISSGYPVIEGVAAHTALVAHTVKKGNVNYIQFKRVVIE